MDFYGGPHIVTAEDYYKVKISSDGNIIDFENSLKTSEPIQLLADSQMYASTGNVNVNSDNDGKIKIKIRKGDDAVTIEL